MSEPVSLTIAGLWISWKTTILGIFTGILGAAVSLKFAPGLSAWEKVSTILAGALLAHFLSSPITNYFGFDGYEETVGFLVGLFGLSLCAAILDLIKKLDLSSAVNKMISKRLGD